MKKFTFLLVAIFMCNILFGQIKVNSSGKFLVGPPPTAFGHDVDNILSATIFGNIGDRRTGSKLAFGDFGGFSTGSGNVFLGEYGTTDTDQLWLHGKSGMYFTRNSSATDIVAYYGATGTDAFYFKGAVSMIRKR